MSLKKWYDSNYLKKATPTASDIHRKFKVAGRDLKDAAIMDLSDDTRFRLAYEAMLVIAQAMLLAEGYRTSSQGSHYYAIESLEHTMGESREKLLLLHAFAKKRHICQYDMEGTVSPEEVGAMIKEAVRILEMGVAILSAKHPEFVIEDLERQ